MIKPKCSCGHAYKFHADSGCCYIINGKICKCEEYVRPNNNKEKE